MEKKESTRLLRRLFWGILPVQAMANGLPAINSLLDGLIVGNCLGEQALAAVGFADMLLWIVSIFSVVISAGAQMLCSRAMGRGDRDGIRSIFSTSLALCVMIGLPFSAACLLAPEFLARLLGATGEMTAVTGQYIFGLGFGVMFNLLSLVLIVFLQMERMSKMCTIATIASVVVNLGGNLVSVACLKWGIFGAGLFTSVSSFVSVCILLPCVLTQSRLLKFSFAALRPSTAGHLLYTGSPGALDSACFFVTKSLLIRYVYAQGGTVAMAALTVAGQVTFLANCIVDSSHENTCRLLAGMLVGNRDSSSLRDLPRVSVRAALPIYLFCYVLIFVFAKPFALLMGAEAGHVSTYVTFIRFFGAWVLLAYLDEPITSIYAALGKVNLLYLMTCINNLAVPVLFLLTLGNVIGLPYILVAYCTIHISLLLAYAVVFTIRAHRLPRSICELCYIPSSVSAPRENRFNATICTVEEAVAASEGLVAFCRNHGMEEGRATCAGLCVEELAVDAVRNRFEKRGASMDLRVIYEEGHVRITLRDDCRKFDPNAWLELCAPEDELRSIGIRMAMNLATETNYVNTLGLNVLTLTL